MPTYEYVCESCGNRYEKREGFDAKARQKCPKCRKPAQRVLFAPPIVFKGSGFYKTDSRGTAAGAADAGGSTTSTEPATGTPAAAEAPGHSHGPGGHSHDAPSTPTPPPTETAAAG